ncbi:MAG: hypothetical protein B0W54_15160 [Cellvibrio sp. 79]|nr:MAG: hypothetical protein B0W54_15160 [Cellvibrio sp. 79]
MRVSIIMFRKTIDHEFFGCLIHSNGCWNKEMDFPPCNGKIFLYVYTEKKEIDSRFVDVWKRIYANYHDIVIDTANIISDYYSSSDLPAIELKDDFKFDDVSLEAIGIEKDLSARFYWGVITKGEEDYIFQVVTEYVDGQSRVLGASD